ncbi:MULTISPECIES: glutamate--tRNA ligase [Methanobacterium]|uniref:Glutamate--tRNA ligase n=1 Tax=Methanobacterium subterraneum TaxID=59277 RepID=A0A2H4VDD7_9EURY|nr:MULTISPECIES: glutamate--tRNA ligase [Methanobacterium]AUB56097.1 glutamate--tRNA ligase [Methanobacterium subterraneum]AUB56872.1 glutamate--tRNA ligase [Methanobacterium sp. MZ-A1]MBW4257735.1 glutamate--tRNA ligase [Methanobacterium sp. YSL]NMO08645.1 glutamate--tRNA ligase [Methanobacterium subterraneum]
MDKLEELVRKQALINAAKHGGQAQPGAVIGMIMSGHPEYRKQAKDVSRLAGQITAQVNQLSPEAQKEELDNLGGYQEKKKEEKVKGLSDLPGAEGKVVLRFAPNPSGPLHIGHARAAVLNHEYSKRYHGKLILRVEDTDPRRVDPSAYQMIGEDLKWMGVEWDEEIIQSDRMEIYYEHALELIKLGGAYMCTCPGDVFKELKDSSQSCPHRDASVEENLKLWEKMPETGEGEMVLRVKTDIEHKNPAIRDWVAMRVVEDEHPRIGKQYRVYPMMNFSVAVDDHLLGVTHVLRGKDHLANSEKQEYLYHHMGWDVPHFIHYGRLKMDDVSLSTSQARQGIEEGLYSGWDDPRLGTIRAIARRGIQSLAIKELMMEIGVKIADSTVTWKKIYGLNRSFLEDKANRYFMVENPELVEIDGVPESLLGNVERPLHPDHLDRGMRSLEFNGKVYLSDEDIPSQSDQVLRLMDAVNITFQDGEAKYHSEGIDEAREAKAKIVQWVPTEGAVETEMVMPDASLVTGFAESTLKCVKEGEVVQLERIGFARLDKKEDGKLRFYYAHK